MPLSEPMPGYFNWTLRNKFEWNSKSNIFIKENAFESVICKMLTILSWPHCVKRYLLVNSSPPNGAHMLQWIGAAAFLVQVIACCLFSQAITWTNAGLLSIGILETNFSEIRNRILSFSFMKMHLKLLSAKKCQPFLSRGDELRMNEEHNKHLEIYADTLCLPLNIF